MTYVKNKEKLAFIIFLLVSFSFYLLWLFILPFGAGPDEPMRYDISKFIYQNGFLPNGGDPSVRDRIWGISYGFTPITSYIISAIFMKITSFFTTNNNCLVMSARLVTVLFSTAMLSICIPISKKLFKHKVLFRWLFLILIAALPQFAFVSAYVNIDTFALFTTAVIVYAWVDGLESNWNYKSCAILAIGVSLCLLSYYNSYGFVLCSVIIFYSTIVGSKNNDTLSILKKSGLIILIILALASWWFIRNAVLYNGDILGISTSNYYAELYADSKHKPSTIYTPQHAGQSLWFMLYSRLWIPLVLRGLVGCFGYADTPLPIWMYVVYTLITLIGIIGCFMALKRLCPGFKELNNRKTSIFNFVMLAAMIIPFVISAYYSYTNDFQPQGRYVMPCIIPLMYFLSTGIDTFISRFIKDHKIKGIVVFSLCGLLIIISILSLTNVLIPSIR